MAGGYSGTSVWHRGLLRFAAAWLFVAALLQVSQAQAGKYPLRGMTTATISNSGNTLLIATQLFYEYPGRPDHKILIAYDIPSQSIRWISGICGDGIVTGRFSPDDTAIVAVSRGFSSRKDDTLGAEFVVSQRFRLFLLDKDGHETAALDENNNAISIPAFLDADQIIYAKDTGPLKSEIVVYDIAQHTKTTVTFRKQDGTPLDSYAIHSLRGMEDGKVLVGIGEYPSYYIADPVSGAAVPFSLEIDASEGKLRGPGGSHLAVGHVAPGRGRFIFDGGPANKVVYAWGAYRYSPRDNTVAHLFDEVGITQGFDAAAGDGTIVYVFDKSDGPGSLFEVVIRRGNYATAQTLPVDLGPEQPWGKCH